MDLLVSPSPATRLQNAATAGVSSALPGAPATRAGVFDSPAVSPPAFSTSFSNATPTEIGLQTNGSVPYHFSAKELDVGGESRLGVGAVVFGMKCADARKYGAKCPEKAIVATDYYGVNFWLKKHAADVSKLSAEEILAIWNVYGCLKVRATSDNARFRAMGTSVINNVVGQRVNAANVWGDESRIQPGTQLYFVLKKAKNVDGGDPVWQFTPFGNFDFASPPLTPEGLMGADDVAGAAVFFGTAMSAPMATVEGGLTTNTKIFTGGVDVCVGV